MKYRIIVSRPVSDILAIRVEAKKSFWHRWKFQAGTTRPLWSNGKFSKEFMLRAAHPLLREIGAPVGTELLLFYRDGTQDLMKD